METVVPHLPDKPADPMIGQSGAVGKPMSRLDGPRKVKGEATFTAEFQIENLAYAALVYSTIAKGKITRIDASEAEKSVGFIQILSHENAPSVKVPPMADPNGGGGSANSTLPNFKDETVYWNGQPIAVVAAETLDQAEHAASLVKVEYQAEQPDVSFDALKAGAKAPPTIMGQPVESRVLVVLFKPCFQFAKLEFTWMSVRKPAGWNENGRGQILHLHGPPNSYIPGENIGATARPHRHPHRSAQIIV